MMVGSVSRILSRNSFNLYPRSQPQAYRFATCRHESSSSSKTPPPDNPGEKSLAAFEDAVHSMVVKLAAPAWLPFRPGTSYWAPPRTSGGIGRLLNHLSDSLTQMELMAFSSLRGEPSTSAVYVITPDDNSDNASEVSEAEDTSESDQEEEER